MKQWSISEKENLKEIQNNKKEIKQMFIRLKK